MSQEAEALQLKMEEHGISGVIETSQEKEMEIDKKEKRKFESKGNVTAITGHFKADGTSDMRYGRATNKKKGVYSTVDFLTPDEVEIMKRAFLQKIDEASSPTNKLVAWRNYTMFRCGINVGLRASDLRNLKWSSLYDARGKRIRKYVFAAQKTGKRTEIAFNDAFFEAVEEYKKHLYELKDTPDDDDYLFFSKKDDKEPIDSKQMWRIMNDTAKDAGIEKQIGSHSLRKTFGRTVYMNAKNKDDALVLLQEWFKHSSPIVTLRYIGITFDQMYDLAQSVSL